MDQLTFGLHRATDPATSRVAAMSIDAPTLAERVLLALRRCPRGATTYALADGLGLSEAEGLALGEADGLALPEADGPPRPPAPTVTV